jgi:hypothetical protein
MHQRLSSGINKHMDNFYVYVHYRLDTQMGNKKGLGKHPPPRTEQWKTRQREAQLKARARKIASSS